MIGTHLAPGAKIVAIISLPSDAFGPALVTDFVYTLRGYAVHPHTGEIGVRLFELCCPSFQGIEWFFALDAFCEIDDAPAAGLPETITRLLRVDDLVEA